MEAFSITATLIIYFLVIFVVSIIFFYKLVTAIPNGVKDSYRFADRIKAICFCSDFSKIALDKDHIEYIRNANRIFILYICFLLFSFLLFSLYMNYWMYIEVYNLCIE